MIEKCTLCPSETKFKNKTTTLLLRRQKTTIYLTTKCK